MDDAKYNAINGWIKKVLMNVDDTYRNNVDYSNNSAINIDGFTTDDNMKLSFAGDATRGLQLNNANTKAILTAITPAKWPNIID